MSCRESSISNWSIALTIFGFCAATAYFYSTTHSGVEFLATTSSTARTTTPLLKRNNVWSVTTRHQATEGVQRLHSSSQFLEVPVPTHAESQGFGPVLLVTSGLFLLVGAIFKQLQPKDSKVMESVAMFATSGEQPSVSSKPGAFSRRGMGPLLTGIMLSPAVAGVSAEAAPVKSQAAAATAPVAPAVTDVGGIDNPKFWIRENLPGSLRGKDFVRITADILNRQGMSPENTVACVGVCRDELCQPLVDEIESEWGDAFNMSSLGGMLTLGKTGLKAAMAHSPVDESGRERYFFLAFPHIAVDTAGLGTCTRPGRPKQSKACGALYAFTSELKKGNVSTAYDPIDPEYSFMKQALLELIPPGEAPDLLDVTKTAAEASLQQIEELVAATIDTKKADYAVCIGVLVHEQDLRGKDAKVIGPARPYLDQVWPTAFYSVVKGRKKDLIWRLEQD